LKTGFVSARRAADILFEPCGPYIEDFVSDQGALLVSVGFMEDRKHGNIGPAES